MSMNCPICGAEVKKDYKFCLSCSYDLQTAEPIVDITVEGQPVESQTTPTSIQTQPTEPVSSVPPSQQPISQQSYQQQTYPPKSPKKSPMIIIGVLIAVIVVVVVVVVILMMLGGESGPLVGEWQTSQSGISMGMKLNGDHSLEMSYAGSPYVPIGQWEEESEQLCITISPGYSGMDLPGGSQCYDYTISEDGRSMTWLAYGQEGMTWTKK